MNGSTVYLCTSMFEAQKGGLAVPFDCEDWDEYFEEWSGDLWDFGIWLYEEGGESTLLAVDGGEPEDNSFLRDGAWIAPALNDAFQRGFKEGFESCCGIDVS